MKKPQKKSQLPTMRSSAAEYLTFVSATSNAERAIEMRYEDENIWLTQRMTAELYGVSVQAIDQHLKTLIKAGELDTATIKQYLIVQNEGTCMVQRKVDHSLIGPAVLRMLRCWQHSKDVVVKWVNSLVEAAMCGLLIMENLVNGSGSMAVAIKKSPVLM